ncbi:putative large exoprotein involved in heme utilization or adhesion of ShlA/HecA/FhaA family [Candidatus Burkholderia pumila]|uniref:Large exoprotein involved in heme utilization or adhesion of ShlA/HecA/FhaA family n=1 Tax=Candidatus Burkholderia pumila TaxID=1090375 RepID=A0ABR5HMH1_9BURK|nr:putative large exoprotein involved in heme utilization or adhesion of ShlA/HecA/FhaA family [Candidatus Burkholderia pumila]
MYGDGAVRLIGTENGVGVRQNGNVASMNGDVSIDSMGGISSMSNTAVSGVNVRNDSQILGNFSRLDATCSLDNHGTVSGKSAAQVTAGDTLTSSGGITSDQGNVMIGGERNVALDDGRVRAAGQLMINGKNVSNRHGQSDAGSVSVDNSNGSIAASRDVSISTPMAASGFDQAGSLVNRSGTGSAGSTLTVAGANVDNTNGSLISNGRVMLNASSLSNQLHRRRKRHGNPHTGNGSSDTPAQSGGDQPSQSGNDTPSQGGATPVEITPS